MISIFLGWEFSSLLDKGAKLRGPALELARLVLWINPICDLALFTSQLVVSDISPSNHITYHVESCAGTTIVEQSFTCKWGRKGELSRQLRESRKHLTLASDLYNRVKRKIISRNIYRDIYIESRGRQWRKGPINDLHKRLVMI